MLDFFVKSLSFKIEWVPSVTSDKVKYCECGEYQALVMCWSIFKLLVPSTQYHLHYLCISCSRVCYIGAAPQKWSPLPLQRQSEIRNVKYFEKVLQIFIGSAVSTNSKELSHLAWKVHDWRDGPSYLHPW
jgi:hypothetical protein